VPGEPGARRPFRTAEAAFQALKYWSIAVEFSGLLADAAFQRSQELSGQEDFTYAGFDSAWQAMMAVLAAKFTAGSCWGQALIRTGDAYLLEHSAVSGPHVTLWDGLPGMNWLGLQLMLIRDQISGEGRWTGHINRLVNLGTGKARSREMAEQWQAAAQEAAAALNEELERMPPEADAGSESEFGGMLVRPNPRADYAQDGPAQDFPTSPVSWGGQDYLSDSHSESQSPAASPNARRGPSKTVSESDRWSRSDF